MSIEFAADKYVIEAYAHLIAEQASGLKGAIPEENDYMIARDVFKFVEREFLSNGAVGLMRKTDDGTNLP